jgi:uncharacterized protein YceK
MKKIMLVLLLALSISGCSSFSDSIPNTPKGYHTEFHPYTSNAGPNCKMYSADVYLINSVPSLLYMCNN